MNDPDRIPVTVLTGFLGAGKTTLLNRVLSEQHGYRIAVIENEFGELGIDGELVVGANEEIVQMNNGCLCCTVRGDLIRILHELLERADQFDRVFIETTGLADPGPVLQTFYLDEQLASRYALDGVITLVDARHIHLHLDEAPEAKEQIAFADVVILNKIDLVDAGGAAALERRVRSINGVAQILHSTRADVPLQLVLDMGGFDLDRALTIDPALLEAGQHHSHDSDVGSVGIELDGDLNGPLLYRWIGDLLVTGGRDIFRLKGVLSVAGARERLVLQGVHTVVDAKEGKPWHSDEARISRLVFVGRNLDAETLRSGFASCVRAREGAGQA